MKRLLLLLFCGLILPGSLMAACGFGARTYGNSLLAEVWGLSADASSSVSNSLSITSGTSGCSNSGLVENEKQKNFIIHTYANLEEDIIKGSGPYLVNLTRIMGCSEAVDAEFHQSAQTTIRELADQPLEQKEKALQFYDRLNTELTRNPVFLNACHES